MAKGPAAPARWLTQSWLLGFFTIFPATYCFAGDWSVGTNNGYVIGYVNGDVTIRIDANSPPVTIFHVQGKLVQQYDAPPAVRAILKRVAAMKLDLSTLRTNLESALTTAEALQFRLQEVTAGDRNAKEALELFNQGLVDEAAARLDAVLIDDESLLAERLRVRAQMYVVQLDLMHARQTSAKVFALTGTKSDAAFHVQTMAYAFPDEASGDAALRFIKDLRRAWSVDVDYPSVDRAFELLEIADFLGAEFNRRGDPIRAAIAFAAESKYASDLADSQKESFEARVIEATSSMRSFHAIADVESVEPVISAFAMTTGLASAMLMMTLPLNSIQRPVTLDDRFMPHFETFVRLRLISELSDPWRLQAPGQKEPLGQQISALTALIEDPAVRIRDKPAHLRVLRTLLLVAKSIDGNNDSGEWRQLRVEHRNTSRNRAQGDLVFLAETARIWSRVASPEEISGIALQLKQLEKDPALQRITPRYVRSMLEQGLTNAYYARGDRKSAAQILDAIELRPNVWNSRWTHFRDATELSLAQAIVRGSQSELGPLYAHIAVRTAESRSRMLGERTNDLILVASSLNLQIQLCSDAPPFADCKDIDNVRTRLKDLSDRGVEVRQLDEPFFLRIPLD